MRLGAALLTVLFLGVGGWAELRAQGAALDEFSPSFLGMYRKLMEIEPQIQRAALDYGVDVDLARAVCLYESGGNAGLSSHAGAQGYFQVMPATYGEMKVDTNIEAGVKYLSLLIQRFGREDRAIAAYNGGPGRLSRGGNLPLETLQYVIGVGQYRSVIKQYGDELRRHAAQLELLTVAPGDTWLSLSQKTGLPVWELRLHNAFLAGRDLRTGARLAYPRERRRDLLTAIPGGAAYRMRHGDNYIKLAITLGIDVEALRIANGLWQVQAVAPGFVLQIPFTIDRAKVVSHAVMAARTEQPTTAAVRVHQVRRGETLSSIARRYATTVHAIRKMNNLSGTTLRVGQLLTVNGAG